MVKKSLGYYVDMDSVEMLMREQKTPEDVTDTVVPGASPSGYLSFPVISTSPRDFWTLIDSLKPNQTIAKKIVNIFARPPERSHRGWGNRGGAAGRFGGRQYEHQQVGRVRREEQEVEEVMGVFEDGEAGEAASFGSGTAASRR